MQSEENAYPTGRHAAVSTSNGEGGAEPAITGRHAAVSPSSTGRHAAVTDAPKRAAHAAHAAPEPKKGGKGPLVAIIALVVIVALAAGIYWFTHRNVEADSDHLVADGTEVTLVFESGSLASDFASELYDAGLINKKGEFKEELKAKGAEESLKPGTYTFTGGMTYGEIVDQLVAGPNFADHSFNVPEGATMKAVAAAVEKAYDGSITAKKFTKLCKKPEKFASDYPFVKGAKNLEGFLFPKSYELLEGDQATAENVIRQMLDQYAAEVASLDYSYPKSQGLSEYETLILASIVEKEGTKDTYAKVAAVFYNRLGNNGDPTYGCLGSDATTAYELGGEVDGYNWSTDSPYNTRKNAGLCPTPICNPSLACLEAVCNPADDMEDYYFFSFWPNDEGGVDYYFDKTYADHQKTIKDHS